MRGNELTCIIVADTFNVCEIMRILIYICIEEVFDNKI